MALQLASTRRRIGDLVAVNLNARSGPRGVAKTRRKPSPGPCRGSFLAPERNRFRSSGRPRRPLRWPLVTRDRVQQRGINAPNNAFADRFLPTFPQGGQVTLVVQDKIHYVN